MTLRSRHFAQKTPCRVEARVVLSSCNAGVSVARVGGCSGWWSLPNAVESIYSDGLKVWGQFGESLSFRGCMFFETHYAPRLLTMPYV